MRGIACRRHGAAAIAGSFRDGTRQRRTAMTESYSGACFCGAIGVRVTGKPEAMGFCHCRSCRSWSAGPVNAFTLWKPDNVAVTQGGEHLGTFHKTETSYRQFCRICGGHLMTVHPPFDMIDVYAATLPDLKFE